MTNAKRDDNNVTTLLAVSNADGSTVGLVEANPANNNSLAVDDWHYGLVPNPDFADQPTFVAATTVYSRWIDGTATGSTTNDFYGWAMTNTSGSNMSASYDTVDSRTCIKMVVTNITRALSGASTSQAIISPIPEYTAGTVTLSNLEDYAIPVTVGERYTFAGEYYLESISDTSRVFTKLEQTWYTSTGTRITSTSASANTTILNTWTAASNSVIAPATAAFVVLTTRVIAGGSVDYVGESATVNWTNLTITSPSIEDPQRALRDENFVPTLLATSSVDGVNPVVVYMTTDGKLLIDSN